MAKIYDFKPVKHTYEIDNCAGCSKKIVDEYAEVILPLDDEHKHIALCSECEAEAYRYGVFSN